MTIYLARHGITNWNEERKYQGWSDIRINAKGKKQAKALARALESNPPKFVYCSTLSRARETAGVIVDRFDVPCREEESLKEMNFGDWEGQTVEELAQKESLNWDKFRNQPQEIRPTGGESVKELKDRIQSFWKTLDEQTERPIAVVTHGGPLRVFILSLLEAPLSSFWRLKIAPASLTVLEGGNSGYIVSKVNDTSHLEDL